MIPIIEEELKFVINEKLKELRDNVDVVDKIFSKVKVSDRLKLKQYLSNEEIKVIRGFPRSQNHVPSYVILLGAEQEHTESIGEFAYEDEFDFSSNTSTETHKMFRKDGRRVIQTLKKPISDVSYITVGDSDYIEGFNVVDSNRGLVEITLDIANNEEVEIHYEYKSEGVEKYGTQFKAQYRIETWTDNGDLTVYLYHLLKYILIQSRSTLEEKDLILQRLSGTDLEPSPEYFPTFVYRRALLFDTTYFATVDKTFSYISDIIVEGDD